MSGDADDPPRGVVRDIAAHDSISQRLIDKVSLSDVSSSFAIEQITYTTALPLDYAE